MPDFVKIFLLRKRETAFERRRRGGEEQGMRVRGEMRGAVKSERGGVAMARYGHGGALRKGGVRGVC